jgi:xanthine dehydrogenase YagS FAD-binding subunit
MYDFTYFDPSSLEEAITLKSKYGVDECAFVAGGTNLLYLMKRGVRRPKYLINIKNISKLNALHFENDKGLTIGSLVSLERIQNSREVMGYYPLLSESAARIASPQIRNVATVGGNLAQDVWCWYLTEGFHCWMNGGRHCYAPGGDNRYHHSVAGGFICLAVHPSDLAPVFLALDAEVEILGLEGRKVVGISELLPGFSKVEGKLKQNTLKSSELITSVRVPRPQPKTRSVFLKYAPRRSFDFSISSVAVVAVMDEDEESFKDLRVVLGGVATKPIRVTRVESALKGKRSSPALIEQVSQNAFEREIPLSLNLYRIHLTRELLRKALLEVSGFHDEGGEKFIVPSTLESRSDF